MTDLCAPLGVGFRIPVREGAVPLKGSQCMGDGLIFLKFSPPPSLVTTYRMILAGSTSLDSTFKGAQPMDKISGPGMPPSVSDFGT
jgi:hypothetical protein